MPWRNWTSEVVPSATFNTFVQQQVVGQFNTTAERDGTTSPPAWLTPPNGAISYTEDAGWFVRDAGAWRLWLPKGGAAAGPHYWTNVWESSDTVFQADNTERAVPGSQFNLPIPSWASNATILCHASGWTSSTSVYNTSNRLRIAGSTMSTSVRARGSSAIAVGAFNVTSWRGTSQQLVWMLTALTGSGNITSTGATSTAYAYQCLFT